MISEWREYKISDIASLVKNSWKVGDEKLPYLGLEHIEEAKLRLNGIGSSDDVASNKYRFSSNDVLFGKLRPYFRKVVKPNFDGICSTDMWVLNATDKSDVEFIFYFFANQELIDLSYSSSSGTRMPRADWKFLSQTLWDIPPLEEQNAIAEVLSSLDDKIDLLHRQNKTLEELAQTLFRQWFIEEAKDEWEEITLGNYVITTTGYSYKSTELNASKNALITLKNFARDGSLRLDGFKEFTGTKFKEKQVVTDGDLVVSHTDITQEADIIGNPIIVSNIHGYKTLIITMDLMKVESNEDWLTKEYLYYLFKSNDFKFHCLCNSNGTTVLHMSRKTIPSYKVKIPTKDKIFDFSVQAKHLLEKQNKNREQIKTLENMRDALLPKLMSGEVRVKLNGENNG